MQSTSMINGGISGTVTPNSVHLADLDITALADQGGQASTRAARQSARQAQCRTFDRILKRKQREEEAFAVFEASVKAGQASGAGCEDGADADAQPRRPKCGRPRKPCAAVGPPARPLIYGEQLQALLRTVQARGPAARTMPVGTHVWVKVGTEALIRA